MPIVEAREVSKWYGNVIALNNFNVQVGKGVTGVVGPNGSGKSTFFKLVMGNIKVNSGELLVMGRRPWNNPGQLRGIGFCPDYDFLPLDLKGRDFLRLAGGLQGLSGQGLRQRSAEVLDLVGMTAAADRRMGGYSKGMKQRIKIAAALLHRPQLLLLDEPLTGTDPVVRRELMDMVRSLAKEHGHDVVVSSHVLHEVERMTHQVVLIYQGRAVASGDISEIRGLMSKHPHRIVVLGEGLVRLGKELLELPSIVAVELSQDRRALTVEARDPEAFFDSMPGLVETAGCKVESMRSLDDDLESVFRYLAGW